MADKEERILIKTYTPICKHLKSTVTEYHDGYEDVEEFCELTQEKCKSKNCKNKAFTGMTRQEAIEKMAEGMCNRATEAIKSKETVVFDFGFYAEAALNALLGVEK